jgi:hypothetical protein
MSDGHPDNSTTAMTQAQVAKENGCVVVTVATGSADRNFMRELASSAEHAYDVDATVTIEQTFVNLAREIASGGMLREG